MLTYNTMRFGTDEFNIVESSKTALLIAKNPITTDEYSKIVKFNIDYSQPKGTQIAFAFTTDAEEYQNQIFKLIDNNPDDPAKGRIAAERIINPDSWLGVGAYTTDDITADVVLAYGNSIADLTALNGLELAPAHLEPKRRLRPVIALKTTGSNVPKVKLSITFANPNDELEREETRTYESDVAFRIIDATSNATVSGDAGATVTAAFKTSADGTYSDFYGLNSLVANTLDKKLYGLKWKREMAVGAVNDSNSVKVKYHADLTEDVECHAFGDYADLYTITRNFYLPLKYCVVVVKHDELVAGAQIKAFVKLDPSLYWKVYTIGTGTGSSQSYDLPVPKFIDTDNLNVYVNGTRTTDYSLWVKDNKITINAPAGATITASSNYNLQTEQWLELDADPTQHDISDGKFTTRYYSKITKAGVYVSAIKFRFFRGTKDTEKVVTLPITPTGEEQTYRISESNIERVYFRVLDSAGNILFDNNGAYHSLDCECSFNPNNSTLKFTVPTGNYKLEVDYRKKAEVPRVYSFTAGYCS